jgi:hypothetical protein
MNNSSRSKIIIAATLVFSSMVLATISPVEALSPEMFTERIATEIGLENGSNQTHSVVDSYIKQIGEIIGNVD